MAVPKKKHTRARTGKRRAGKKLTPPNLVRCPSCKEYKPRHVICPHCGGYHKRALRR